MNMNVIVLGGRLVRDPELKNLPSGTDICEFSIATERYVKGEKQPSFFDFVAFGKTAENIAKFFSKGSRILVRGEATQERWEDRNGNKRNRVKFIVNGFDFVDDTRDTQETSSGYGSQDTSSGYGAPAGSDQPAAGSYGDDEIPF